MHHSHHSLAVVFIVAGGTVVFMVAAVALGTYVQRQRNAGPLQERWYEARDALNFRQRR